MNKLIRILLAAALFGVPAFATVYGGQVDTTSTTLTSAVSVPLNGQNTQWCLASATNVSVPSITSSGSYLVVDKEAGYVEAAGSGSLCFVVKVGQLGSAAMGHRNGRKVWVSNTANGSGDSSRPFTGGAIVSTPPSGTCNASLQYSLPIIYVQANNDTPAGETIKYYCIASAWANGIGNGNEGQSPYSGWTTYPTPGNVVAPAAVTDVSGKLWFSQIYVGSNTGTTGACILSGSGGATDSVIFALWDSAGTLMANSALTGAVGATSLLSCQAWVSPIILTGPNTYFIGVQGNGTTAATFSAYKTGGAPTNYLTGVQTGGAFGTILNITTANIPTTFTTAVGPYMSLY